LIELKGIGIGDTAAEAVVFKVTASFNPEPKNHSGSVQEELEKLTPAINKITAEMNELAGSEHDGEIFEALAMLVSDEALLEMAIEKIKDGLDAGSAFHAATVELTEILREDADFSERANDVLDLATRVWAHTECIELGLEIPDGEALVLVADDFAPADTAKFNSSVKGVITRNGGPTSHVAILCRSKGIPAVVGVAEIDKLDQGQKILIDPAGDRVLIDGAISDATVSMSFAPEHEKTLIPVLGNVGNQTDAEKAKSAGGQGVGLFRTEFAFLNQEQRPSIDQQLNDYLNVLNAAPKGQFIARTLDAGSDKPLPFLGIEDEENPALGVRGFRINDTDPEFMDDQLNALKLAEEKSGKAVSVMAPMIARVSEAKKFAELARDHGFKNVGIMVETPSIIFQLKHLKGVIDFVSIGTNDLSQYLFAADRLHPKLGTLLDVWQPALLEAIKTTVDEAHAQGIKVGVCGEAGSDPMLAIVLAGLGVDTVSASPSQVEAVSNALKTVDAGQAKAIALAAVSQNRATFAREAAKKAFAER
jgi:phosphotransferase system enzyme I (PtsI)